ncbi:F-box/kelch-repeat protein SKIP4 [Silene latifolia]|uniref:F-box/kelch-repeat protein SKIP4 n=1 Tax=Silene latifolia TaxID=37657 RepID=UPI003D76BEFD
MESYNDQESSHCSLIHGLPDDIALFCLARVPRKYHTALKCVSKRWRDLICSDEWRDHRRKNNLGESWIYALCRDKNSDQLCCYSLDPSCTRQGCWKSVSSFPPRCLKRKGMGFEVIGKKLYLLGGCGWSEDAIDEVYCYDVAANTWSEAASMPTARCYFGCSTLDGKIYAIGGYGLKTSIQHSWDTYNSHSNTWDSHSDSNIILDIEDSIVMDGEIYVRSRTSAIPPHVSMATYNPSNARWQRTDGDMALGWQGPAVVVEDNLYVLDQSSGTKLTMWVKETREWVTVCRLSSLLTRPPCQMVAAGRKIFIVGRGLSTVVLDVGNVGNTDRVVASSSIPVTTDNYDVISCKCVSI